MTTIANASSDTNEMKAYTVEEFSKIIGVGKTSAWKLIAERKIGHIRVGPGGKCVRVLPEHIIEYCKQNEVPAFDAVKAARKILGH